MNILMILYSNKYRHEDIEFLNILYHIYFRMSIDFICYLPVFFKKCSIVSFFRLAAVVFFIVEVHSLIGELEDRSVFGIGIGIKDCRSL